MSVPVAGARATRRGAAPISVAGLAHGSREHTVSFLAAGACAVLAAVVYLGAMTYTLAHYRHWEGPAALFVSVAFALIALLAGVPHLVSEAAGSSARHFPRAMMWGTCLVLALLQITAAVLGADAQFSLSALIGTLTVLAVACFGEMAAFSLAEA
ncbi:hypothetical protein I3F58_04640 [Streptomyces sp. MUM 203J]|uniref:hypothetical protein n=1 Tax=Streptomyces sp. MUM 203J TaxID=2791990 RepID=UPI001F043987|nr:hypothetical protein [Streptomyces sp. MUM 203J]MCH0538855.1 hypothetical protein [Streptomyces sp. MUM 203J]